MIAHGIRHIIWDWNGTLLDDVTACVDAINAMIRRRGLRHLTRARYRALFQFPVKNYYKELGFDLDAEDWDDMAREFHAYYAVTSRSAGLRPGMPEMLGALHACGVPMSVLSASEESILRSMLHARGIANYFEHVRGLSNLYAASKLELGRHLIADLELVPAETLLVGDTTHDHEVARALGCRCVLVQGGHQSEERLLACGCPVVSEVAELQQTLDHGLADARCPSCVGVARQ